MNGYFRKRNGKWSYTVDVGTDPKTGRRKQKTKGGFNTKREAIEHLREYQAQLDARGYIETNNILFNDFAEQYIKNYDDGTKKPSTVRLYKIQIEKMNNYFGLLKLKDINRNRYQDMLDEELKTCKRKSVVVLHSIGSLIFREAFEMSIIKNNPTEFAKVKQIVKTLEDSEKIELPKFMDRHELIKFLEFTRLNGGDSDYQLFTLMAHTGLRSGEALALKNSDVDLESMEIRVSKTIYHEECITIDYKLVPPKTKKSNRIVAVSPEIVEMLREQIQENRIQKMARRNIWHDGDFLFPQYTRFPGYATTVSNLGNRFRRLIEHAKIGKKLSPHSLRHTHTSLLAEAGVGLTEIMDRLGHANDRTTTNIYLHVTKDKKREAALIFSKHLKGL